VRTRILIALLFAASMCRADLHSFAAAKQAARDGVVRFTYDAVVSIDPVITSTLGDLEFRWTKPNGDTFYGKAPSGTNWTETGTYVLWCSDWSKMSQLNHSSDAGLTTFDVGYRNLRPLISLTYLQLDFTSVEGDISGWTLPSSLTYLQLNSTSVEGDISGWTLPSSLTYLRLHHTSADYDSSNACFTNTPAGIREIRMEDCALTESQVDNVLVDCDTSGVTNSGSSITLNLSGTDAAPSATGLTAYSNLVANGWTVTKN